MANLLRSAKSGSGWGRNELLAHHITVAPIPPQEFFGQEAKLPLTGLDLALINSSLDIDYAGMSNDTYRFLGYLDLTTNSSQETAVDDFARELLRICGFEEHGCILRTRHITPLSSCGESGAVAQTDAVPGGPTIYDLARSTRGQNNFNPSNPELQVIAEAIAAYQHNNERRARMDLPTLNTMTIPCITMVGTCPTFYLVPVTQELSDAIITGQWPQVETKNTSQLQATIVG